ncbi:unknown [Clostridium sp. CAG:169]|nr:unknown [Clostridium sp. CAG:169]
MIQAQLQRFPDCKGALFIAVIRHKGIGIAASVQGKRTSIIPLPLLNLPAVIAVKGNLVAVIAFPAPTFLYRKIFQNDLSIDRLQLAAEHLLGPPLALFHRDTSFIDAVVVGIDNRFHPLLVVNAKMDWQVDSLLAVMVKIALVLFFLLDQQTVVVDFCGSYLQLSRCVQRKVHCISGWEDGKITLRLDFDFLLTGAVHIQIKLLRRPGCEFIVRLELGAQAGFSVFIQHKLLIVQIQPVAVRPQGNICRWQSIKVVCLYRKGNLLVCGEIVLVRLHIDDIRRLAVISNRQIFHAVVFVLLPSYCKGVGALFEGGEGEGSGEVSFFIHLHLLHIHIVQGNLELLWLLQSFTARCDISPKANLIGRLVDLAVGVQGGIIQLVQRFLPLLVQWNPLEIGELVILANRQPTVRHLAGFYRHHTLCIGNTLHRSVAFAVGNLDRTACHRLMGVGIIEPDQQLATQRLGIDGGVGDLDELLHPVIFLSVRDGNIRQIPAFLHPIGQDERFERIVLLTQRHLLEAGVFLHRKLLRVQTVVGDFIVADGRIDLLCCADVILHI